MLSAQCRAARALLNMDQETLASTAGISRNTVADFESGKREPRRRSLAAMQVALENAGVLFIEENGDGPGVRLRYEWAKPHRADDGLWIVLARWKKGDPVESVPIEKAFKAADEAGRRGEKELEKSLRAAAAQAVKMEPVFLKEAIERYERIRAPLDKRYAEGNLNLAEAQAAVLMQEQLNQAAEEIAAHRASLRSHKRS